MHRTSIQELDDPVPVRFLEEHSFPLFRNEGHEDMTVVTFVCPWSGLGTGNARPRYQTQRADSLSVPSEWEATTQKRGLKDDH
jgi:hypothetical protein